jgi:hypothetical protein
MACSVICPSGTRCGRPVYCASATKCIAHWLEEDDDVCVPADECDSDSGSDSEWVPDEQDLEELEADLKEDEEKDADDEATVYKNRCIECGVDMGDCNPRQLCGKTRCLEQH